MRSWRWDRPNPHAVRVGLDRNGADDAGVRARLEAALAAMWTHSTGGSTAPSRLLVLEHPPSIDNGEITDKGYINQRAVIEQRSLHVEQLHMGAPGVIWPR
jgi:feruloyl-CoA synthase